jgi:hypothetical protein
MAGSLGLEEYRVKEDRMALGPAEAVRVKVRVWPWGLTVAEDTLYVAVKMVCAGSVKAGAMVVEPMVRAKRRW